MAWKDVVPKRKAGQRALFIFLFPCLIPAAWDAVALLSDGTCHSPSFSCSSFMSLCWLRASGGCCSQAPGSSFALAQAFTSSGGDELLSWEHSSVWSYTEKKVSSPLSRLFIVLTSTSTINSRRLFWNLSLCELLHDMTELPGLPAPVLPVFQGWAALADCRCLHPSLQFPPQHAGPVCLSCSWACSQHICSLARTQYCWFLRTVVGKLNYLRMHSLHAEHWSSLIHSVTHVLLWEIYCFSSTL